MILTPLSRSVAVFLRFGLTQSRGWPQVRLKASDLAAQQRASVATKQGAAQLKRSFQDQPDLRKVHTPPSARLTHAKTSQEAQHEG